MSGYSLAGRALGSLAVKALPAIYGAGFILFVLRVVSLDDFGRYTITISYVNLLAGISRGLWLPSLVGQSALGQHELVLGPAFWYGTATAVIGGLFGLILLPILNTGFPIAVIGAIMLISLVPRDLAFGMAQAQGRIGVAFLIEAGYFIGSLGGFTALLLADRLTSAEMAMAANVFAAILAMVIGVAFYPTLLRPRLKGRFREVIQNARWYGLLTLSDMGLQQGDALIGAVYFSPGQLAPYLAARTLLKLYALFSQAINFLAYPVAARLAAAGEYRLLKRRLRLALAGLMAVLVPVNIVVYLWADEVFPWLLGAKYAAAVPFFRVIILITFLEPVYSVVANAMVAAGRSRDIVAPLISGILIYLALTFGLIYAFDLWGMPLALVGTFAYLAVRMYVLVKQSFTRDGEILRSDFSIQKDTTGNHA